MHTTEDLFTWWSITFFLTNPNLDKEISSCRLAEDAKLSWQHNYYLLIFFYLRNNLKFSVKPPHCLALWVLRSPTYCLQHVNQRSQKPSVGSLSPNPSASSFRKPRQLNGNYPAVKSRTTGGRDEADIRAAVDQIRRFSSQQASLPLRSLPGLETSKQL